MIMEPRKLPCLVLGKSEFPQGPPPLGCGLSLFPDDDTYLGAEPSADFLKELLHHSHAEIVHPSPDESIDLPKP